MLINKTILRHFDSSFDTLYSLETIIKITQATCQNKEIYSNHYNLSPENRIILSEERNHYINMLDLALDKINHLKEVNQNLEQNLYQVLK